MVSKYFFKLNNDFDNNQIKLNGNKIVIFCRRTTE